VSKRVELDSQKSKQSVNEVRRRGERLSDSMFDTEGGAEVE
jgi:hypothetical protein